MSVFQIPKVEAIIHGFQSIAALIVVFALASITITAQDDKKKRDEQKKQEKAVKAEANADKDQAKREQRYKKIRDFAKQKWDTEADFKDVVDHRYRGIREEHTRYAYLINMRPSNNKLIHRDGEKLRFEQALYDNPLAQDYVNRVGQSLVPRNSNKLYAFKIVQNPVPEARALSTGTVYISTGYLSIIDNEAQLAYILGHEIAHIEKEHWFEDVLVDMGTQPYMEKKEALPTFLGRLGKAAGTVGGTTGGLTAIVVSNVLKAYGIDETFLWENIQEDEADTEGMKYMFERNYDVREIQTLYARMQKLTADPRSQTGFIADPSRITERLQAFNRASLQYNKVGAVAGAIDLADNRGKNLSTTGMRGIARMVNETLAPEIQRKLEAGELMASGEEFQSVMAMVKRDNGIRAFQFDMFALSRNNLEDSISIRSNDPSAYYYYGKVLKQTARNSSEISLALANLHKAIQFDKRQTIAEPYLFRAMLRLTDRNPNETRMITEDLRTYVSIYQRENAGMLPANMDFIYDVMQDFEVMEYRATPAMNTANAPSPVTGLRQSTPAAVVQPLPVVVPEIKKTSAPRPARKKQ